jgi:twinkle protein
MNAASGSLATTAATSQHASTMKANGHQHDERAPLAEAHAEWLEQVRKIPCEVTAQAPVASIGPDLAFEFRKNGKLCYRKLRKESQTGKSFARDRAGVPTVMWNVDCLTEPSLPDEPLVITEGEIDALSWMAAGLTHVVSVPDGAQLAKRGEGKIIPEEDKPFAYLWDGDQLIPGLDKFKRIILSTDNDEKGRILRDELAVRLGRVRCWFVDYPDGCKDANEVLVQHGVDRLTDLLADAKPLVPNRLVPFSHIAKKADRKQYTSGWKSLDDHLRLQFPELMVVTGSPNSGKSTWTLNYVCNLARIHGVKSAILQFEDDVERNRSELEQYVYAWSRTGNDQIHNPDTWIDQMFRTISPAEEADVYDIAWLKSSIIEAATRHDCKVILIDPFNEIEHLWSAHETEAQYTNNCLRDLKKLARQLQIAIIIVTHPAKSSGTNKPIDDWTLYDVAGAAAWNNKADHGVIIWRENTKAMETYVKVCKSKNFKTMGVPGTVIMQYVPNNGQFSCIGKA